MLSPASPDPAPRIAGPEEWSGLMARAQQGDQDAYRRLLTGITPWLRALALRAHRDPAHAEDSVQDILLTLHATRATYDPARPFRPWLGSIARHRILDRLRSRGRAAAREVALEVVEDWLATVEPAFDPADAEVVVAAVRLLPKGQRDAVTMLKLREMSLHQAAEASGLSIGSLKVASHRGLKALRRLLLREE